MADKKNTKARDTRFLLHSAYSLVRSVETGKALASLTLDHLLQEHIDSLKKSSSPRNLTDQTGKVWGSRYSKYDQLEELKTQLMEIADSLANASSDEEVRKALGLLEDVETIDDEDVSESLKEKFNLPTT